MSYEAAYFVGGFLLGIILWNIGYISYSVYAAAVFFRDEVLPRWKEEEEK